MTANLDVIDLFLFTSFGVCQTIEPYVVAGHTTAVYTCLALANDIPQVDVEVFVKAILCLTIFCIFRM